MRKTLKNIIAAKTETTGLNPLTESIEAYAMRLTVAPIPPAVCAVRVNATVPPTSTATAGFSGRMVVDPTGETVEVCEVPLTLTVRAVNAAGSETVRIRESICWVW